MDWFESFRQFLDPQYLVETGGFLILILIIFAETGLFFGFFFPGDSLLFTAGLLASLGILPTPIIMLLFGLTSAGILGNFFGYGFGGVIGSRLYKKEDSFFFKKKYIYLTEEFFERYGRLTLIAGRFLPIIRTFAPIMAGVIKMNFIHFAFYNVVGSVLWVCSLTLAGYFLGEAFPEIGDYLEYIIIGMLVLPLIPIGFTYFRQKKKYNEKLLLEKEKKIKKKLE